MSILVQPTVAPAHAQKALTRLGVVQYLNTLPLIAGLDHLNGLQLQRDVPANLFGRLMAGEMDAALCSCIDYQRTDAPLVILPCGLLGCDGETMTVRLFSKKPFHQVRTLAVDVESHTSRVLAAILLQERFGVQPTTIDLLDSHGVSGQEDFAAVDSVLLIGDKAVLTPPPADIFMHHLDLGAAWKEWTGLPFTFAIWMAPAAQSQHALTQLQTLCCVLDHQRRRNVQRIDFIAAHNAVDRGWSPKQARRYLQELLQFGWNSQQQAGLERFWLEAYQRGLTQHNKSVEFIQSTFTQG